MKTKGRKSQGKKKEFYLALSNKKIKDYKDINTLKAKVSTN